MTTDEIGRYCWSGSLTATIVEPLLTQRKAVTGRNFGNDFRQTVSGVRRSGEQSVFGNQV
jgi:hypothetical protein